MKQLTLNQILLNIQGVSTSGPAQRLYDQLKKEVTDRGMEVKETLKKFQGKVFHAVNTTHGTLLRYRYVF